VRWYAYLDLPYGYEADIFGPEAVDDALRLISPMSPVPVDIDDGGATDAKSAALDEYVSQMRGLGARRATALRPERLWRLQTPGG
jgi:hypothetical protein